MQVRDEVRQEFDAGRQDAMANIYSKGMGDAHPPGPPPVGQKRGRYSHHDADEQDESKRLRGLVLSFCVPQQRFIIHKLCIFSV